MSKTERIMRGKLRFAMGSKDVDPVFTSGYRLGIQETLKVEKDTNAVTAIIFGSLFFLNIFLWMAV